MFGGTYLTGYADDESMQGPSGWACLYYAIYARGTGCKAKLNREVLFISYTYICWPRSLIPSKTIMS